MLYMMGIERHPDLPDVRSLPEFGRTEEDKQVFRLLGSISDIGRSIVAGPGTPMDRAEVLRGAVAEMVKDPAFITDAAQLGLGINYLPGPALQRMVDQLTDSPSVVIEKARAATAPQK
jgi:hypothetical protein